MKFELAAVVFLVLCSSLSIASDVKVAPWTSPKLQGQMISCWGREYIYSSSLLPSAVVSQGGDILVAPIGLAASIDGHKVEWGRPDFKVVSADAEKVCCLTTASAGRLKVECTLTTEFDGMTRVDMKLIPSGPVVIDSLDITVPLKPEYARFFHHSSVYPAYEWDWPKKQMNSGAVGASGLKLPFVFHLWLGNDNRGLQLFSESDEVLSPADRSAVVTVTPGKQVTQLRVNLLNNVRLSEPWSWTFGFVATPVKPFPKDYHNLHYCQMGAYNITKSPGEGQLSYLEIMKGADVNYLGFHEHWSDEQSLPRPKNPEDLKSLLNACHQKGIALATYTGCYMSTRSPEYSEDWDVLPFRHHYQYERPDNKDICRVVCNNSGWPDLLIKSYTQAFKDYKLDGVYMDGLSCPLPCTNTKHGCGYTGKDGQVHPTMPIWKTRDVMKRFYRLVKSSSDCGLIVSHTSSSILLPALSFADVYLDGEHLLSAFKIGTPEYSEDILRAQMSGHNFGIPGTQLPIRGDNIERERARTLCLLYDILTTWHPEHQADIWRACNAFDVTGAEWVPFWSSKIPATCNDASVRTSSYVQKGRGALLVVANLGAMDTIARLVIHPSRLGLADGTILDARDKVNEHDIDVAECEIAIPVTSGSFRLISVQKQ